NRVRLVRRVPMLWNMEVLGHTNQEMSRLRPWIHAQDCDVGGLVSKFRHHSFPLQITERRAHGMVRRARGRGIRLGQNRSNGETGETGHARSCDKCPHWALLL